MSVVTFTLASAPCFVKKKKRNFTVAKRKPDKFQAWTGFELLTLISDLSYRFVYFIGFSSFVLSSGHSLPALGFVRHAFTSAPPWGRNECVTNESQRTSAGRLLRAIQAISFKSESVIIRRSLSRYFDFSFDFTTYTILLKLKETFK